MVDKTFQDGDVNKVQNGTVNDSMFEDIGMGWSDNVLDTLFNENQSLIDSDTGTTEQSAWTEAWTSDADVTEESGDNTDAWSDAGDWSQETTEGGEGDDAYVQSLIDNIWQAGEAVDEADKNLQSAIEGWDNSEIQKAYSELQAASNAKDRQIEILTKELQNEKANSDKFLNERFLAETEGREKSWIFDTVMENPLLKEIVIYSKNMDSNPQYKEKLADVAKKFYEEVSGVSIDQLLNQSKVSSKMGMADWSFISDGEIESPDQNLIGGMFEQI